MTEDQKKNLETQLCEMVCNAPIANFLFITDKKVTTMDKQITEIETFKKGLLQRMFV